MQNGFADPRRGRGDFVNGKVRVDLHIIKNIIVAVFHSETFRSLFFGIDHFIGAVAQQELCVHIAACARKHKTSAKIFEQSGRFQ